MKKAETDPESAKGYQIVDQPQQRQVVIRYCTATLHGHHQICRPKQKDGDKTKIKLSQNVSKKIHTIKISKADHGKYL